MRILGLDPGSRVTGYGVVERRGSELRLVGAGLLSAPKGRELGQRLAQLAAEVDTILERYRPQVAVLEKPFHGVNSRSLIVLAQARGALLASLARQGVPIRELSPAEIKKALTGNGRASKEQVARMVAMLVSPGGRDLPHDASDAVAVALCYAQGAALKQAIARAEAPSRKRGDTR